MCTWSVIWYFGKNLTHLLSLSLYSSLSLSFPLSLFLFLSLPISLSFPLSLFLFLSHCSSLSLSIPIVITWPSLDIARTNSLFLTTSLFPLHPGSVISGHKFLEETLFPPRPCSIERGFHSRTKELLLPHRT
jgi:hypothetical protein